MCTIYYYFSKLRDNWTFEESVHSTWLAFLEYIKKIWVNLY